MNNLDFYIAFLLFILSSVMYAQPMDTITRQVVKHSPDLKKMDFKINAVESRADAASWFPEPMASVTYAPLPVETRLGAVPFQIGVSQSIPWFGRLEKEKEAILSKTETIRSSKQLKRSRIILNAQILYVQLYVIRKLIPTYREQASLIERILNIAHTKYETASTSLSHILEIENLKTDINEKIDKTILAEEEINKRLNILRDFSPNDTIFTPDTLRFEVPDINNNSYDMHPAVREKYAEIEHLRKLNKSIDAQAAPDFKVGLTYGNVMRRPDVELENNGRDQLMINAGVQIPLWTGKYRQMKESNTFKQQMQREEITSIKDKYREKSAELYAEYERLKLQLKSLNDQISRLDRIIELRIQEYSTGDTDIDDILRTLNDLVEKESTVITVEQKLASVSYQYQFLYTKYQDNE